MKITFLPSNEIQSAIETARSDISAWQRADREHRSLKQIDEREAVLKRDREATVKQLRDENGARGLTQ